jgi:hypothetical protein
MIKIEITGNSIAEVSDKLLAIGASLRGCVTSTAFIAAEGARKPANKCKEKIEPISDEAPVAAEPVVEEPVAEKTTREISFDAEIAPLVLRLVRTKGPEAAKAVLSQFGVQRASQVDPARYEELLNRLRDAL